ncbi:MAG: D-alanyl-D-alanine dipeptidase [Gloeocapsa sp. DLM2.Bin57]|nr:MAG: D-alanyl-D-alanine dipeptidase [Gloeocapsa sp. DLM2.Bin57]
MLKPYHQIAIQDCGESLVAIPLDIFSVESPPPYLKLGANYGGLSPYYLREGVVEALQNAQNNLQQLYPNWRLHIFDAYRPVAVQQFMVDYTFNSCLISQGLVKDNLTPTEIEAIYEQVYQIWAIPSTNPLTPPPHSTGGAVDLTIIDDRGLILDFGSVIDELSPRSHPDYYLAQQDSSSQEYHQRRELLNEVMCHAGFCRHPGEWWHFCLGDQMWCWLSGQSSARYGIINN